MRCPYLCAIAANLYSTSANSSLDLWAGYYEGQPTRYVVLTCAPSPPIFIAQAQNPHWISGLATMRVNRPGALSLLVRHRRQPLYSTSANPSLDLWAGHYEGQPTRYVVLTCTPSLPTGLHSTSTSSSLADVFGNVNISEEALKWAVRHLTCYFTNKC